jgi:TolB protein
MRKVVPLLVILLMVSACLLCPTALSRSAQAQTASINWRDAENGILADQVQLTFSDRFVKAGESYFSPDDSRIIFQAVEVPPAGEAADEFYAMFVADVKRETASGRITGLDNIRRISPKGSANTCGWFHPTDPNTVIFATTLTAPTESTPPGYQRASGRYKWMFPPEMRIVQCDLRTANGTVDSLKVLVGEGKAYCAEGSLSADGRHLLYCSLESGEGDVFVQDQHTQRTARIVQAKGYDGGPFFSPDGKRICYRSDRDGDNLLQLFVADLAFNERGEIIGIEREYQLTDNENVNWCPFWTRDGRRLVYSTSAMTHHNYEIFMCDADPGNLPGSSGAIKYGSAQRRISNAEGADVLPAFSHTGQWMIWTSQRHADKSSQLWAARMILNPDSPWKAINADEKKPQAKSGGVDRINVTDPESGRIFIYDPATQALSEYHMDTHTLTDVIDPADIELFHRLYEQQEEPQ